MKESQLKKIIKEEIQSVLKENSDILSVKTQWDKESDIFRKSLGKWIQYMKSKGDNKNDLIQATTDMINRYFDMSEADSGIMSADKFTTMPKGKVRKQVVEDFIEAMRKALKRHETSINSSLDNFEDLNLAEFDKVQEMVNKQGWKLTKADDNYQSTMYSLIKLKPGQVKEYTDDFDDDNRQFNMSFSFDANNKNDVVKKFNNAKNQYDYWRPINKIADWIENTGFKNNDDAFNWLENMYNASKIKPGEAVAFHYSPTGWILAAKDGTNLKEFITSDNKLDILTNAAQDINRDIFSNRGQYNASNYQLIVRDRENDVLKDLDKKTEVKKQLKGFAAKDDEAKQFYQLPNYNVAIAFEKYGMTRGTIIQFLSFDGEYPERKGMT